MNYFGVILLLYIYTNHVLYEVGMWIEHITFVPGSCSPAPYHPGHRPILCHVRSNLLEVPYVDSRHCLVSQHYWYRLYLWSSIFNCTPRIERVFLTTVYMAHPPGSYNWLCACENRILFSTALLVDSNHGARRQKRTTSQTESNRHPLLQCMWK